MKIVEQSVELLWSTPDPEKVIELAGRTCYKSEDKITDESSGKFVKMIHKRGHHAMIEHASASFRIICDRGIGNEIVRHRIASYAQKSTRYVRCDKGTGKRECTFIQPPGLVGTSLTDWQSICLDIEETYFNLLDDGHSPQIARSVLPLCLETEIVMTANLREWLHFINLRIAKGAHPQIRVIAQKILIHCYELAPNIFEELYNQHSPEMFAQENHENNT